MNLSPGLKRAIIIIIYAILFLLIIFSIYMLVKPKPSCFDGKQNQNEENIDCGGPCSLCEKEIVAEDIVVEEKNFVFGGQDRFDIFAKLMNPNRKYGASSFSYKFSLKDESGNILVEEVGDSFILPADTKYVLKTNIETSVSPANIDFEITEVEWVEFSGYEKPEMEVRNKKYNVVSSGTNFGEALGVLRNKSDFDFSTIKINVILRDSSGEAVALNSTEIYSVKSREEREFILVWPTSFPGEVQVVDTDIEVDVYDSSNFMKRYLPRGKFQDF